MKPSLTIDLGYYVLVSLCQIGLGHLVPSVFVFVCVEQTSLNQDENCPLSFLFLSLYLSLLISTLNPPSPPPPPRPLRRAVPRDLLHLPVPYRRRVGTEAGAPCRSDREPNEADRRLAPPLLL